MRLPVRIFVLGLVILASSRGARTASPILVTSTGDSGAGTLRQAILDANGASGADVINFAITGTGVKTITLLSALPDITDAVTIDGYTQTGAKVNTLTVGDNATLTIVIDGNKVFGAAGLRFLSGSANSLVKGLVINDVDPGSAAIEVRSANVAIEGNFIGTDAAGTNAVPTGLGILINGGSNTRVGGTAPAQRNLISGTWDFGLAVASGVGVNVLLGGDGTLIQGNYIGTDASGTASVGNTIGVLVGPAGATTVGSVTIGGTAAGAGNLISGQVTDVGIKVEGSNTGAIGDVTIQGNIIGLDATGTASLPNGGGGIANFNAGPRGTILVGGTSAAARNIISGGPAIIKDAIDDAGGINLVVQGNYIGTDITGTVGLNGGNGITVAGNGASIAIGGSAAGAGNVISGNARWGIRFVGGAGGTIQGNLIGLQPDGSTPLANGVTSIETNNGSVAIGGTGAGEGNRIFHLKDFPGIDAEGSAPATIRGNSIITSGTGIGLGIDLFGDGVTPNDSCDADTGPNGFQNFPVITSAVINGTSVTIGGTLNSTAGSNFSIDLFSNTACNQSGNGEGLTYLGSVPASTDGTCNGSFSTSLAIPAGQTIITGTATDSLGDTSEFSACFTATVVGTTTTTPTPSSTLTMLPTLTPTLTPTLAQTQTPAPTGTPVGVSTPTRTPTPGTAVVVPTLGPRAQALLAIALAILAIGLLRRPAP